MALLGMTRNIISSCHQERTSKAFASLLSNHIKRYYVKDPKKITSKDIPQKPEDCGCSRLPKTKSSKRKEKEKVSKTSETRDRDKPKHGKSRSKEEEDCHQPPSPEVCKKGTKQKETEYTEEHRDECACEPCEQEVEAESAPKQIDCAKAQKKNYQPDCSKLKQAHVCNQRAKGKHEESKKKTSQSGSKSQAKLEDCCQSKKSKSTPKIKTKAEECNGSKSTALYCAKRLNERKAGEIQSCADTTPVSDKPKTIECALGKKMKESKPVCKHKQKETCSSTKPKQVSTKSTCKSLVNLQKQNVRTINPCDTSSKPKGCTTRRADTHDQKKDGNLLKILGIPAVILAILGLLYQYAPPPPPPPDIS